MKNLFEKLDRIAGYTRTVLILICSLAMVTLLVTFTWLVFGRYVLNVTPTWVEQLALLLICYITFLGSAVGIYEESHLGVDFIREKMPVPIRDFFRILVDVMLCGFGLIMMIACTELVEFGWSTKLPMLGLPEGVRTLPAAICGGLTFVYAGLRSLSRIHSTYFDGPADAQKGT